MINPYTLKFLQQLNKNNNKPWFEANRDSYEKAKNDFLSLVEELIAGIGKFDEDIAILNAKNCVFRQYRDVRFSKDKLPYKVNMGAYMNRSGKKTNTAGYYIHIEPGKSFVAGGLYHPEANVLAKVRQEIDYNLKEWKKILSATDFKKHFPSGLNKEEILSRPPKGYNIDNPALEFLKLKSFIVDTPLMDDILFKPSLNKTLLSSFKSLKPMLDFLNRVSE